VPTLAIIGPYRFFFWSNEGTEPAHVHVERDAETAKFWLDPVALAHASGFSARELRAIEKIVIEHGDVWKEAWNEYFNR
jgi:Domain of unknown function (DUF4160)